MKRVHKLLTVALVVLAPAASLLVSTGAEAATAPPITGVNSSGDHRNQSFYGNVISSGYADRITLGQDATGCTMTVAPGRSGGTYAASIVVPFTIAGGPVTASGAPYCPDMGVAVPQLGRLYADIAVTWYDSPGNTNTQKSVYVLRNFRVRTGFISGGFPNYIGVADFNGDGRSDIWLASNEVDGFQSFVDTGSSYVTGPINIPSTDFVPPAYSFGNLDGKPGVDVVDAYFAYPNLAGQPGTYGNGVVVALGDGSLTVLEHDGTGSVGYATSLADVNRDGALDVLVDVTSSTTTASGTTSVVVHQVWLNDGHGHFTLRH